MINNNFSSMVNSRGDAVTVANPVSIMVNEFTEASALNFMASMAKAATTGQTIVPIFIDSRGGEVHSLVSMLDVMQASKLKIATIAIGKAMSCGALLLGYGDKGLRFVAPNATVMMHDLKAGTSGSPEQLQTYAKHVQEISDRVLHGLAKHCGIKDVKVFQKKFKESGNVDHYLTPEETLKWGLADHIGLPEINFTVSASFEVK